MDSASKSTSHGPPKIDEEFSLVYPQDRQRYRSLCRSLRAGEGFNAQYRVITPSSDTRDSHEIAKPAFDESRKGIQEFVINQDITERKCTDTALLESEALHRQGARMAHLGHWLWDDIEGRLQWCSEEYVRIFEMSVDEMLSIAVSYEADNTLTYPEDRQRCLEAFRQVDAQQTGHDLEDRNVTRSGAIPPRHELGEPIVDSTGRLVRSIGTLQDITERNHTEEVLRPSRDELEERVKERTVERRARETRLKQAAQTAKLGHWCFDEIGKAYISVSEEYASLFGYTVEEFLERFRALDRDMVLVHEADREKFSRRTKSVKIGGRLPHRPVRWKRASSA